VIVTMARPYACRAGLCLDSTGDSENCRVILNELTERIIGAAIRVHRALGPGLLESTYEACLYHEITKSGLRVERQKPMPLVYDNVRIECSYRADLLVEGMVILELKAVERLDPIHSSQLYTYLKLSDCPVGLIINFNVLLLKDGIKRINNQFSTSTRGSPESPV
jgi:GxxExxY protein